MIVSLLVVNVVPLVPRGLPQHLRLFSWAGLPIVPLLAACSVIAEVEFEAGIAPDAPLFVVLYAAVGSRKLPLLFVSGPLLVLLLLYRSYLRVGWQLGLQLPLQPSNQMLLFVVLLLQVGEFCF